jgi:hypothetical protein
VPPRAVRIPYLGTTLPPQQVMDKYFGPIGSYAEETWVDFAGHRVQINKVLAQNLRATGDAVAAAGLAREIRTVGGFRTTVGGSGTPIPYSMHQYGAAFDINEDGGPNGNWQTMRLDPALVAIMAAHHWFCGENWAPPSYDGGHFQFTGGTRVLPGQLAVAGGAGVGQGGAGQGAVLGLVLLSAAAGLILLAAAGAGVLGGAVVTAGVAALAGSRTEAEQ